MVSQGLETTLRLLTQTKNEAAVGVLIPALDSARVEIQEGALRALLDRHSEAGSREIVRRLHQINERWEAIIDEKRGRLTRALRDAVLATEPQLCANGCRGVLWFQEYDLLPALVTAAEDESNPNRELAATTLLKLAELLYEELAAPRDYRNRRDPQLVRQHVLGNLELAVRRYPKHRVGAVIEAFLLLAHRDNLVLKQILMDPLDPCYLPLVDILAHGQRDGVIRLVLSFLEDPRVPSSAITLLAHRTDSRFVERLVRKIGAEPSPAVAANLKRIDNVAWLQSEPALLERLDDAGQHAAVQLAMRSGMNRRAVYKMIEFVLRRGNDGGRTAASAALEQFSGVEANSLCLRALDDPCPDVQANALRQLRTRGIPGALTRLVDLMESPYEVVQRAVRESLAEFNFKRFLAAYDMLDDEVRRSTGSMVRKIDPEAIPQLQDELTAKSRTRRLRAITVAVSMGAVADVEQQLLDRLGDEDHVVRAEAARALGGCNTPAVWQALADACGDRSVVVQEAAEESLVQLQTLGSGRSWERKV
jgi:HEAT repeat protein